MHSPLQSTIIYMATVSQEAPDRPIHSLDIQKDGVNITQGVPTVKSLLGWRRRFLNRVTTRWAHRRSKQESAVSSGNISAHEAVDPGPLRNGHRQTPPPCTSPILETGCADPPVPQEESNKLQGGDLHRPDAIAPTDDHTITGSRHSEVNTVSDIPKSDSQALQAHSTSLVAEHIPLDNNFYTAVLLKVDPIYMKNWEVSWHRTIKTRLKNLNLKHPISNIYICMAGSTKDNAAMEPTIVVSCNADDKKQITHNLTTFIANNFKYPPVKFKVIPELRLTTGDIDLGFHQNPTIWGTALLLLMVDSVQASLVGVAVMAEGPSANPALAASIRTIGGLIQIGDSILALTVAHTLPKYLRKPAYPTSASGKSCGKIEHAQWSASEELAPQSTKLESAQDWMTIIPSPDLHLPNSFQPPGSDARHFVQDYERNDNISNGNVWVCGGITGVQAGYLLSTPSTLTYQDVEFPVLNVALMRPLADGDSGSWVIKNGKLCGYIMARLDEKPWAYVLPIESVFDNIQNYRFTVTGSKDKITLPTPEAIQRAREKRSTPPEEGNVDSHQFMQAPNNEISAEYPETSEIPGIESTAVIASDSITGEEASQIYISNSAEQVSASTFATNFEHLAISRVTAALPPQSWWRKLVLRDHFDNTYRNSTSIANNSLTTRHRILPPRRTWSSRIKKLTIVRDTQMSYIQYFIMKSRFMWKRSTDLEKLYILLYFPFTTIISILVMVIFIPRFSLPNYAVIFVNLAIAAVVIWFSWTQVVRRYWPTDLDVADTCRRRPSQVEEHELRELEEGHPPRRRDRRLGF